MIDKFEFQEAENAEDYNPLLISKDSYFTQSFLYGEWQKQMGHKVKRFKVLENQKPVGFFQVITYSLPFGKSYLYVPHGPVIKNTSADFLKDFSKKMTAVAQEENAVFLRYDIYPPIKKPSTFQEKMLGKKAPFYSYHSAFFQSKFDWVLDIQKSEEELLAEMHQKTRYNIRLAERKGVRVEIIKGKDLNKYFDVFYTLMQETAERGKFGLHPKRYYENIFEDGAKNENINLFVGKFQNEILVTNLVVFYGETAFYPFGASSQNYRNLMVPYLVHWKAIEEAKQRGLKYYNFGAIDAGEKITHENWSGISAFKKKFGGEVLEYSDFYDFVFKSLWYNLYNLRKRIKSL